MAAGTFRGSLPGRSTTGDSWHACTQTEARVSRTAGSCFPSWPTTSLAPGDTGSTSAPCARPTARRCASVEGADGLRQVVLRRGRRLSRLPLAAGEVGRVRAPVADRGRTPVRRCRELGPIEDRDARLPGMSLPATFVTSIPALALFQPVLDDPAGYIAGLAATTTASSSERSWRCSSSSRTSALPSCCSRSSSGRARPSLSATSRLVSLNAPSSPSASSPSLRS